MLGNPISKRAARVITMVSVAFIIIAYFALSAWKHGVNPSDKTIPNLGQLQVGIGKLLVDHAGEGRWFFIDLEASGYRWIVGLALGSALGFGIGTFTGCFQAGYAALLPLLATLGNVPALAMLCVYFVFVPSGDLLYVVLVAGGILPSVEQGVRVAVRDIRPELIDTARMRGASTFEIILHVIVPQVLPRFIDLVISASAFALGILVGSEMAIGGGSGIGYRINILRMRVEMSMIFPYLFVLAVGGLAVIKLLTGFQKWKFGWYNPEKK